MASRRRLARVTVMQTLFEGELRAADPIPALERNISECGGKEGVDCEFADVLLEGIEKERESVTKTIQSHAPEWPWERMDTITRCILLVGAYELLKTETPPAVVMNEAIEVAKEYGTEESAKFVNGVLNALAHAKGKKK